MKGTGWRAVLALLVIGCGASPANGPARTAEARTFARGPMPAADRSTVCDAGDAAACTRAGDAALTADPLEAERLWLAACRHGEAAGCERLMSIVAEDPDLADDYGRLACELGSAAACSMAGRSAFARWRAGSDSAVLQRAFDLLGRGCGLDDWGSCWTAAMAYREAEVLDEAAAMQTRASALAAGSCARGGTIACEALASDALGQGDRANSGRLFARACALQLASTTVDERLEVMSDGACAAARELGAQIPSAVAVPPDAARWMTSAHLAARRVAGTTSLPPEDRVRLEMVRRKQARIVARFYIEVTALGLVRQVRVLTSSGHPAYDLHLLQAARRWRYAPHVFEGVASDVNSSVVFIYNQRPR